MSAGDRKPDFSRAQNLLRQMGMLLDQLLLKLDPADEDGLPEQFKRAARASASLSKCATDERLYKLFGEESREMLKDAHLCTGLAKQKIGKILQSRDEEEIASLSHEVLEQMNKIKIHLDSVWDQQGDLQTVDFNKYARGAGPAAEKYYEMDRAIDDLLESMRCTYGATQLFAQYKESLGAGALSRKKRYRSDDMQKHTDAQSGGQNGDWFDRLLQEQQNPTLKR